MYDPVVVFDTVVFVRALINPHSFWGRLVFEHSHEYRLIVTPQILREYVEVLKRPELTSRFSTLKGIDVARILEVLQKAEVVIPDKEPQVSRDSKDNKFLAAAEEAHADYLVSEDRDLLGSDPTPRHAHHHYARVSKDPHFKARSRLSDTIRIDRDFPLCSMLSRSLACLHATLHAVLSEAPSPR